MGAGRGQRRQRTASREGLIINYIFVVVQQTANITFLHLHLCLFVCKIRDGEEWLKWRNGVEKLIDGSESAADGWCESE